LVKSREEKVITLSVISKKLKEPKSGSIFFFFPSAHVEEKNQGSSSYLSPLPSVKSREEKVVVGISNSARVEFHCQFSVLK